MPYNDPAKVQAHYDAASPHYEKLWGRHIHHGYWVSRKESKEEAAQALVDLLIQKSGLGRGARVLDVGCGVGGTSVYLAQAYGCNVTGVTISPVQAEMAAAAAKDAGVPNPPDFRVMDANTLAVEEGAYDVVWSVEMISHLQARREFFLRAAASLKPGGRMCITDWWKAEGLSPKDEAKYIHPIERGMLVDLPTASEYAGHLQAAGLRAVWHQDISSQVARTWDLSLKLITDPALWRFAVERGAELVEFLRSFKAMRAGFKSGAFRYPAMVLEKE